MSLQSLHNSIEQEFLSPWISVWPKSLRCGTLTLELLSIAIAVGSSLTRDGVLSKVFQQATDCRGCSCRADIQPEIQGYTSSFMKYTNWTSQYGVSKILPGLSLPESDGDVAIPRRDGTSAILGCFHWLNDFSWTSCIFTLNPMLWASKQTFVHQPSIYTNCADQFLEDISNQKFHGNRSIY